MLTRVVNLKRWGGPIVVSVIVIFCVTTLVLHATLTELDDEDLLSQTNDWRQSKLRQLEQQVAAKVNNIMKKKKKTSNDPVLRHHKKTVRQVFEEQHGVDMERIRSAVETLRQASPLTQPNMTYDILNCPEQPPPGYPQAWNILDVLQNWNPDNTDIPQRIYQGLCVFDFEKDHDKALVYRQAELPFVLLNQPDILRTTERWSHAHYLPKLIGPQPQRNEHSRNHHFMFWRTRHLKKIPNNWQSPTDNVDLSYTQWLKRAQHVQSARDHTTQEHWYFRLNGEWESMNHYLYDELPIFNPTQDSFYMVNHKEARGINCRFGMKGVISEAHFDPTRNFIALLGGQRRYILAHPDQCQYMELYEYDHPSGRHSKVDWSNPKTTPPFSQTRVTEIVLQASDALYLPTSWFHYIVSLNINYQCNARSGTTDENKHFIHECGFAV